MSDYVELPDIEEFDAYVGSDEWHAVYTIQLSELIADGLIDWLDDKLNWSSAAYSAEQFTRLCKAFEGRFMWREISMLPPSRWMQQVKSRLIYELMPKYRPLYEAIDEGINPIADSDEYEKRRSIDSAYPETLLSGNSDYISGGNDTERETVRLGNITDRAMDYAERFRAVDAMILDELECFFISMYTSNVNGW